MAERHPSLEGKVSDSSETGVGKAGYPINLIPNFLTHSLLLQKGLAEEKARQGAEPSCNASY